MKIWGLMDPRGIASSIIAAVLVVIVLAVGLGYFFIATREPVTEELPPGEENQPPGGPPSGPYYHQIYSATSSDGINWTVDNTLLFDHASVPGAVYFYNKLYLYYVNAEDRA